MASLEEKKAELAEIQDQLEAMVCAGRPGRLDPAERRRYGLLLAREELLLLELCRT